ncbi:MAG: hypothetical protein ACKVPX_18480 [Myxococcaceae bacterium]
MTRMSRSPADSNRDVSRIRRKYWISFASTTRRLASALLVLSSLVVSPGCFVLQDAVYLETLANRPPRIVEEGAFPDRRITVPQLPGCAVNFSVPAEDPDVDDSLTARWYVDYDRDNNPTPFREFPPLPNTGRALRAAPAALTIPLDALATPLTLGEHVVEVLISDGDVINRVPQPRAPVGVLPDGGRIAQETYAVTYAWFIEVTSQGTVCP